MQLFLTTTGTSANVTITDLGGITFTHPIVDLELIEPTGEFTIEDIQLSEDLLTAITGGEITLKDNEGNFITNLGDLQSADGDNLGNHTATQDLDLADFNIIGTTQIRNNIGNNIDIIANNASINTLSSNGITDLVSLDINASLGLAGLTASTTGTTSSTLNIGFTNIDLSFSNSDLRLNNNPGASGQYISSNGTGVAPTWNTLTKASITDFVEGDYVHTTNNESIAGVKTFIEDLPIIIDAPSATMNLEIGWLDNASTDCFGIRQSGVSGLFCLMSNADNPQIIMGNEANTTGAGFIDVDNNRPLNLNVLDTGDGTQGIVNIGVGGLTVAGETSIAVGGTLRFEVETDGTLNVGNTTNYEAQVTSDDDIPNKKYVDDFVTTALNNQDLAALQIRRTTQLNPLPTTWVDYDFDTTDLETDDSVIEHNDTNRDDIDIKVDGLYWIFANITADDECEVRVRVNDTTVIPGSSQEVGDITDATQIMQQNNPGFLYQGTAGEKLTLQIQARTTAEFSLINSTLIIIKLDGVPGAQGTVGPTGPNGNDGNDGPAGFGVYAWADVIGATGVVDDGLGLSIVRNSAGDYSYTFDSILTNNNFAVHVEVYDPTIANFNTFVNNRSTTGFDIEMGTGDSGGSPITPTDSNHTVFIVGPNNGAPSGSTPIYSIMKVINTAGDQTTNYNINGTEIGLVLSGTATTFGTGNTDFSNSNGSITCNFTGAVKVSYHIPHTSTGTRASLKTVIQQDIGGGFNNISSAAFSYIRNGGGQNKDDNIGYDIFYCTTGDIFRIGMRRSEGSTVGAAINILENTAIRIERIE